MAEFTAWTRQRPDGDRWELVAGEVVAMAPERAVHNQLKAELWLGLRQGLLAGDLPCRAFADGMAVVVDEFTLYEPDAMVRCGEPVAGDVVAIRDPIIVVEVVSPSSQGRDTGAKLADYFRIPTLVHYLIAHTDRRLVIHHRREGEAALATALVTADTLALTPPGITLDLAAVYQPLGL